MDKLRLGTRGSKLALWQAEHVAFVLKSKFPQLSTEIIIIKTTGDKNLSSSLSKIGEKGLFTKELEDNLLSNNIDLAIHSLKDLPVDFDTRLTLAAVMKREDPSDVLLSNKGYKWANLPIGARIGTSSLRRRAQIKSIRPDLEIVDIRGNIDTRIAKMIKEDLDGIVLAYAGLVRLDLTEYITDILPYDIMLPAVGQGAIAIQTVNAKCWFSSYISALNHHETLAEVNAERSMLKTLQGGCQVPIGALAKVQDNGYLSLEGIIADLDGKNKYRVKRTALMEHAEKLGEDMAMILLNEGGKDILNVIRN